MEFGEWITRQQQVGAGFSNQIIASDEAHFHLDDIWDSRIHEWLSRYRLIHNVPLFGEDFRLIALSDHPPSKLQLVTQQQLMVIGIAAW